MLNIFLFFLLFDLSTQKIELPNKGYYRYRIFQKAEKLFLLDYYEGNVYDLKGNLMEVDIFKGIDKSYCKDYLINPFFESEEYLMINFDYLLEEKPYPFLILKKDFKTKRIIWNNFYEKIDSATVYKNEFIVSISSKSLINKIEKDDKIKPLCEGNPFFKKLEIGVSSKENLCFLASYNDEIICSFLSKPLILLINPLNCNYNVVSYEDKIKDLIKRNYSEFVSKIILVKDKLYLFLNSRGSKNRILIYDLLQKNFKDLYLGMDNIFYEWYIFDNKIYAIDECNLFIKNLDKY